MDTTITHNDITFVDAQAMRLAHPETFFWAPSKEELDQIKIHDMVMLCVNKKSFWVEVEEVKGDIIKGRVDNKTHPVLKLNQIIQFPKNCIIQINY